MDGTTAANGLQEHEKINELPVVNEVLKNDETEQTVTEDVKRPHIKNTFDTSEVREFIGYIRKFRTDTMNLTYDKGENLIAVIFDYHSMTDGQAIKGHCDHVAILKLEKTHEYKAWKKFASQKFSQQEFAELLEKHGECLVSTKASELYDIVADIKVRKTIEYSSTLDHVASKSFVSASQITKLIRHNSAPISKDAAVSDQSQYLEIPSEIKLRIPVYHGYDAPINVKGTLHYHLFESECLKFWANIENGAKEEGYLFNQIVELTRQAMAE